MRYCREPWLGVIVVGSLTAFGIGLFMITSAVKTPPITVGVYYVMTALKDGTTFLVTGAQLAEQCKHFETGRSGTMSGNGPTASS
jgi:hypothetical protein